MVNIQRFHVWSMNGKLWKEYLCSCGFHFKTCGKPKICPRCHDGVLEVQ